MKWPGLDQLDAVGNIAGNSGPAQGLEWPLVTAPGMKAAAAGTARKECWLLDGWTFIPIGVDSNQLGKPRATRIPERWPAERDYVAAWYVKRIELAPRTGERIVARFEQVPLFCVLHVNGLECGRHLGAYTPFELDVTHAIKKGDNLLALYVHDASAALGKGKAYNQIGSFRPASPTPLQGGVWGGVRLERRPPVYVDSVFVKTSTRRHELTVECELNNAGAQAQSASVDFALLHWPDGAPVALPIPSRQASVAAGKIEKIAVTVPWSDPQLWSPDQPNLYVLRATLKMRPNQPDQPERYDSLDTRFGFREFWADGQQFMLNGVPIRLRGESHFGLGKTEQATDPFKGRDHSREECLSLKKRYRSNAARMHGQIMSGAMAQGADEAGYLMIAQSSIWSVVASMYRNAGEPFLDNTRREFAEWIRRDRNSPSIVIWDVENEQLRMGENNKPWAMRLDGFVREHDDTRLVEHSGAGWYDKDLQIVHLHHEEQFTDIMERWRARDDHPLVMGEWWVGFQGGEFCVTSSPEFHSRADYTRAEARLYEEEFLQMRNYGVSGIMPFQVSRAMPGFVIEGGRSAAASASQAARFGDHAEECAQAVRHGMQPLTIFFWPRVRSAPAGEMLKRELVVCNDSETARTLTAEWSVAGAAAQKIELKLAPAEQRRTPISFVTPGREFRLTARLLADGKLEASEELSIRVAQADRLAPPQVKRRLVVYEGARPGVVEKLMQLGMTATAVNAVPAGPNTTLWVIGPGASDAALDVQSGKIRDYLEAGGRVLSLAQEQWPIWSPVRLGFSSALKSSPWYTAAAGVPKASRESLYSCYSTIYAAGHPIFNGVTDGGAPARELRFWSPRDGRVSDDALVRPAVAGDESQGAWRVLAGSYRPEFASLVEARVGKGTIVFCQAQVLEQSQTAEARLVLLNLLHYLDREGWRSGSGRIELAGAWTAAKATALSGAPPAAFAGASPGRGDTLIATDGADPAELDRWADAGGTVLVLSSEVACRLAGYAATNEEGRFYAGAYGEGHPLLWGVSLESFMGIAHPCVEGVLTKTPPTARVLLHGLSARASAGRGGVSRRGNQQVGMFEEANGPVAVFQPHGKGAWIITTMTPWRGQTLYDGELMRTLLANAGVAIPIGDKTAGSVEVLKTAPLKIDGRLDDWTSDMEDRNVSQYVHARPIVLAPPNSTGAQLRNDADLSAIVYLLWNERALYLAGVVFNQGGTVRLSARIDGHVLSLVPAGKAASVALDGKTAEALGSAFGQTTAGDLTDARLLSLNMGETPPAGGKLEKAPGVTFEIELPWSALGRNQPPGELRGLIGVERADGAVIQCPAEAARDNPDTWLKLTLAP